MILAGGPWLPNSWLNASRIRQTIRALARKSDDYLVEYGNPYGYLPLREHLAVMLGEIGVTATPSQIVLTENANVAVPRTPGGPDLESLERLAAEHRPKVYFTQSVLQNPTSTGMNSHVCHRLLQVAERYGFYVVEDDIFSDLQTKPTLRLAALDQLERVIYARSFSKTLSGSLRVGFLACSQKLANDFADVKMLTSIAISQVTERLVHLMLVDGHYRKYLGRLRQRLDESRAAVVQTFERVGLELFAEPQCGMFLWARFPLVDDSLALAERAMSEGIMLAPGNVFRPHLERSPWMRFNVAVCDDPRVHRWLERTSTPAETATAK